MVLSKELLDHVQSQFTELNGLDFDAHQRSLLGMEPDQDLGNLFTFLKKAGNVVKNVVSVVGGGKNNASTQKPQTIILQQPAQQPVYTPAPNNSTNKTLIIVGVSILAIAVVGGGIYFATRKSTPLNSDTEDLGEAQVVESASLGESNVAPVSGSKRKPRKALRKSKSIDVTVVEPIV